MKKYSLARIWIVCLVVMLMGGCGDSNPLLGTWEGDLDIAVKNPLERQVVEGALQALNLNTKLRISFTETEMIIDGIGAERRTPVTYRREDGKYFVSENGKVWQEIPLQKNDTILWDVGAGVKFTLHRVGK